MRKIALQISAALVFAGTAHAGDYVSCRTEAAASADEWSATHQAAEGDAESAESEPLLVISYGKKYIASRSAVNPETKRPHLLGSVLVQRNQVYHEELDRCLGRLTIKIVGPHPLTLKQTKVKRAGQN